MTADGFTLFDTAIGRCGIAWNERSIVGVQLPESRVSATRARLLRLFPGAKEMAPPDFAAAAIDAIVSLVDSGHADLTGIELDMSGEREFRRRVYQAAREIPAGETMTYGEIAMAIGAPGSARAVGQALGRNPFAIVVPCHRVVAAGGKAGGFSASGGVATKMKLLTSEQAALGAVAADTEPAGRTAGRTAAAGPTRQAATSPARRAAASAAKRRPETPAKVVAETPAKTPATSTPPVAAPAVAAVTGTTRATADAERDYAFDPAEAVAWLRRRDRKLAGLMNKVGPFEMRMNTAPTVFGMLSEALVYQQLSGKAAATIFGRFRALFGQDRTSPQPHDVLGVDEDTLRGVGLSRAKALSVTDLAHKVEDGTVPELAELRAMPDSEVVSRLVAVRGIGRWTAEMFLIFRLGRPDVLPLDDFGVRKGAKLTYRLADLPGKDDLATLGDKWRPFRTVAAWYLWQALELAADEPG